MAGLGAIGRAYLRRRPSRSISAAIGVVLGVGALFGVLVAGASTSEGFDARQRLLTGDADVILRPIGAAGSVLAEGSAQRLRSLDGVDDVTASLGVASTDERGASASLFGVDGRFPVIAPLPISDGRLPVAGRDELVHTVGHGPPVGAEMVFRTATGEHRLTVVGLMRDEGVGSLADGTAAITSLTTAQRLAGRPGAYDTVRAVLSGVDEPSWLDANQYAIAGAELSDAQSGLGTNILVIAITYAAVLTLFVAAFLIYLTLSGAIAERTTVYGTLRALGASRRQVSRAVLMEALWLSGAATIVGLIAGLGIGALLTTAMVRLNDLPTSHLVISARSVIVAAVVGIGVSALAAWAPARRAGRLTPVTAMRGEVEAKATIGRSWRVGAVLAVAGGLGMIALPFPLGLLMMILFLAGVVLLLPLTLGPLAALAALAMGRSRRSTHVTLMHLVKERSRSAYTLGLILVVLAMAVYDGAGRKSLGSVGDKIADSGSADMTVMSGTPIPPQVVQQVRAVPGVQTVSEQGFGRTTALNKQHREQSVGLVIIDPATFFDAQPESWQAGDDRTAKAALSAGGAVLLPEPMAQAFGVHRNDAITLRTSAGLKEFTVAGLITGSGNFAAVVGRADADKYWGGGQPIWLLASIADNANAQDVRAQVRHLLHAGDSWAVSATHYNVADPETLRTAFKARSGAILNIFLSIVAVALIAGLLGMANTLAMSVLQRTREIGVLRALGSHTRDVAKMIVVEAGILTAAAYLLAIPIGTFMSLSLTRTLHSVGFSAGAVFPPVGRMITLIFLAAFVAVAASALPARRAARLQITRALHVE